MEKRIVTQKITTNLWFNKQAEEAVNFYLSVFKNSRTGRSTYYSKDGEMHGMPEGTLMTLEFELDGHPFVALNGGPYFKFTEAVSFIVNCENQEEIDYYWEKLTEGGDEKAQICGWLKDKFGVSWQIVPTALIDMLQDKDTQRTGRVMTALLKTKKKIDLSALEAAYGK